jgi:hypothetical protein
LEQDLIINGQVFEEIRHFRYSSALTNSKNVISDERKNQGLLQVTDVFYSLRQIIRSTVMSKAVKIEIYKTMVKPTVVYGSDTWAVAEMDMKRMSTWERKILRRIHGPEVKQETQGIRINQELRERAI